MTNQEYAKKLVRTNGLEKARAIATKCFNNSGPENWAAVPKGKIFCEKVSPRSEGTYSAKHASATHGFWTEVVGILKKLQ